MFRFTIRDLLWLTLLAAFAVAWWLDRSRLAVELEKKNADSGQIFEFYLSAATAQSSP